MSCSPFQVIFLSEQLIILTFFYDIIILGSETRKKFYVQYFTVRKNNMTDFKKNQAV